MSDSPTQSERVEALEAMLRRLEWCLPNAADRRVVCPVCMGSDGFQGHYGDCELAELLESSCSGN